MQEQALTSPGAEAAARGVGGRSTLPAQHDGSSERTHVSLAAARWLRQNGLLFAVGLAIFWLALDDGAYSLDARSTVAIVVWSAVAVGAAVSLWPRAVLTRSSIAVALLLAAFAALQGLSATWGDSAEKAFEEFTRVALYLGVFTLVVLAARRGSARQWGHGLALGVVGVGLLALTSRLFPDLFGPSAVETFTRDPRLSYPVEYWNGLAVLIALGLPFLLHAAVCARRAWTAGLALAPFPALVATMYFTSSRGGAVAALAALGTFVALTTRRPPALAAGVVAFVGSAIVVIGLQGKPELVNGELDSGAIASQGRAAAVLIAVASLATAVAWGFMRRAVPAQMHLPVAVKRAAIVLSVLLVVGGIAAADPQARFESLKQPPHDEIKTAYVQSHILSSGGSGRWQFWEAAVEQFKSDPLLGAGAGSYEAWWAQHGTLYYFTRNGHSLFFETLGELGAVGLVLLLALVGAAFIVALRRLRAAPEEDRPVVAALTGALIGFVLAAATDWVWDLTVVAVIAIVCLGLLVGPASVFPAQPTARTFSLANLRRRAGWRVAGVVAALAFIAAQAIPLLAHRNIRESQEALREGDVAGALAGARDARSFQGWAASPHLQLALVEEHRGHLDAARESIHNAIERDPSDWRLWAVASRIEEAGGSIAAARRSFDRAESLNPRSPLFANSKAR